jgi:hypothetical protein
VTSGVKLNADTVGWVSVEHMLKFQIWVTANQTQTFNVQLKTG